MTKYRGKALKENNEKQEMLQIFYPESLAGYTNISGFVHWVEGEPWYNWNVKIYCYLPLLSNTINLFTFFLFVLSL